MHHLNVQVLLFYYNRPQLVQKFALESVFNSTLKNWELSFIDDSTDQHGPNVLEEFLYNNPRYRQFEDRVKMYQTNDTLEMRKERGNSIFGKFANLAMAESEADISVMLCDDDALLPDYTLNLNSYYINDPSRAYSFSHIWPYDPSTAKDLESLEFLPFHLNGAKPLFPSNAIDSSQVSWLRKRAIEDGITFPFPQTHNLDAVIYQRMSNAWGACPWNGFYGQYKGWFGGQLGRRGVNVWDGETEK